MSQSVKIPSNMNPFYVEVNGKTYSYPAGTTQTVPDDVAAVIENLNHNTPKPDPEASNFPSFNDLRDRPFGDLPTGGDTLTWDGNTDNTIADGGFFLISDIVITRKDLVNGYILGDSDSGTIQIPDDSYVVENDYAIMLYTQELTGNFDIPFVLCTQDGIWFFDLSALGVSGFISSLTIPGYTGFPSTKKLDSKYLPGAVILYVDAEAYLYATEDTSDTSKRITKTELADMMQSGRSIYVYLEVEGAKVHTICAVFEVTSFEYGVVQTGMAHTLYTAEYTG